MRTADRRGSHLADRTTESRDRPRLLPAEVAEQDCAGRELGTEVEGAGPAFRSDAPLYLPEAGSAMQMYALR